MISCFLDASALDKNQTPMASMEGHHDQALVNRKWVHKRPYTSISSKEAPNGEALFSTTTTTSPPPTTSVSPWHSQVGLQTTQPRPVFSPHSSYKRPLPESTYDIYLPPSNSDLSMGAMNSRDQNAMNVPLRDPLEDCLPPSPPQVNGARLGFIIVL